MLSHSSKWEWGPEKVIKDYVRLAFNDDEKIRRNREKT